MSRYLPDWHSVAPDDKRKVMSRCTQCDEEILEYDEIVYSEYLDEDFCSKECFNKHLGVIDKYYGDE